MFKIKKGELYPERYYVTCAGTRLGYFVRHDNFYSLELYYSSASKIVSYLSDVANEFRLEVNRTAKIFF